MNLGEYFLFVATGAPWHFLFSIVPSETERKEAEKNKTPHINDNSLGNLVFKQTNSIQSDSANSGKTISHIKFLS